MASAKPGAPAVSTAASSENSGAASHLELSEKWSRQVLASLRSLNESLAQVRQSVTKIDHVAQHKLQAAKTAGAATGQTAAAPSEPKPAQGFLAAAASLLQVGAPAPAAAAPASTEALKELLLSPSLAGCAIAPHVLDELVRQLDDTTAAAVRLHLSTPPATAAPAERTRPHTPPPASWHSPGKHGSGPGGEEALHSARVAHSTLDAEVQTEAGAAGRKSRSAKHAHFSESGVDAAVVIGAAAAAAEDSSDEESTPAAGAAGGNEDTSEERALAEAVAHKGGKIKRNASNDKVSAMAGDYDSDDDDDAVGTPAALEADIAAVSAHLTAPPAGMLPLPVTRGMSKNERHGVDTPKEPDGVHGPEHVFDSFRVPPAASADAPPPVATAPKPRVMFRFQRFVEEPAGTYEDDGAGEDVPVNVSEVSEAAFFAMEEEAAELRRMKAQLQALRAAREAEKRQEGAASAAAPSAAGAAPPLPPDAAGNDAMVIWEEVDEPRVLDWYGGDAQWPTAAKTDSAEPESDTDAPAEAAASASVDADDITSSPAGGASAAAPASARQRRFEAFALRVVYEAGRTGFEEAKEFNPPVGSIIAGRYIVRDFLGSAAFSSAIACDDMSNNAPVCLKVIKNNKDFFDQSLDEIKLLRYINAQGDADSHHVLRLIDYFYHKEHLFLVTELLKDNLYEFQKYLRDNGEEPYFTIPRIQRVTKHVLEALAFIHSKGLVHCDLKPENILIKSYSKVEVKVIDFGSSCFVTDHLSSYIQSRSYRAPEVVLGMPYGPKIDVWSLGCILCELLTGEVLFANDSVQTMLGRMQSIFGPFPQSMLDAGRDVAKYFSAKQVVYERMNDGTVTLYQPRRTSLRIRLRTEDADFLDFVAALLTVDPDARPTAAQALRHPWLSKQYELEPYVLPAM